eukprot:1987415-Rhodomonas_salina.2
MRRAESQQMVRGARECWPHASQSDEMLGAHLRQPQEAVTRSLCSNAKQAWRLKIDVLCGLCNVVLSRVGAFVK